jgi:polysaccharide export outer membrane protein
MTSSSDFGVGSIRVARLVRSAVWPIALLLATSLLAAEGEPPAKPEYRIGAGDNLIVYVADLEKEYPCLVRPDGRITIPLAGEVIAEGVTPTALSRSIAQAISKVQADPTVDVAVTAINSYRVFMLGEVRTQGSYASQVPLYLLQAIAQAGGFTEFAKKKVSVVRRKPTGGREEIQIPLDEVLAGKSPEGDLELINGDVVVVR